MRWQKCNFIEYASMKYCAQVRQLDSGKFVNKHKQWNVIRWQEIILILILLHSAVLKYSFFLPSFAERFFFSHFILPSVDCVRVRAWSLNRNHKHSIIQNIYNFWVSIAYFCSEYMRSVGKTLIYCVFRRQTNYYSAAFALLIPRIQSSKLKFIENQRSRTTSTECNK